MYSLHCHAQAVACKACLTALDLCKMEPDMWCIFPAPQSWIVDLQMFGYVEKDGKRLDKPFLAGSWNGSLVAHMPDSSEWALFETNPLPLGPNR